MGLFKKPTTARAPASTVVRFQADEASVDWQGAPEVLVRSPHIYLDWGRE
jgi:hypothetical protein